MKTFILFFFALLLTINAVAQKLSPQFVRDEKVDSRELQLADLERLAILSISLEKERPKIVSLVKACGFEVSDRVVNTPAAGKLVTTLEFIDPQPLSFLFISKQAGLGIVDLATTEQAWQKKFQKEVSAQCQKEKKKNAYKCKNITVVFTPLSETDKTYGIRLVNNFVMVAGAEEYYRQAKQFAKDNDDMQAIRFYSQAIEQDTTFELAYLERGRLFQKLLLYDKASVDFNKAIRLNPANAAGYFERGLLSLENSEAWWAVEDFNKVIELNPGFPDVYFFRGKALLNTNEFQKAKDDLTKAIEVNPKHDLAYLFRGRAKVGLQDTSACDDFRKANELNKGVSDRYLSAHCK